MFLSYIFLAIFGILKDYNSIFRTKMVQLQLHIVNRLTCSARAQNVVMMKGMVFLEQSLIAWKLNWWGKVSRIKLMNSTRWAFNWQQIIGHCNGWRADKGRCLICRPKTTNRNEFWVVIDYFFYFYSLYSKFILVFYSQ